jgi:hypothetical protein
MTWACGISKIHPQSTMAGSGGDLLSPCSYSPIAEVTLIRPTNEIVGNRIVGKILAIPTPSLA